MMQIIGLEALEAPGGHAFSSARPGVSEWVAKPGCDGPHRAGTHFRHPARGKDNAPESDMAAPQSLHSMRTHEPDQIAWTRPIGLLRQLPGSAQQVKKSGFSAGDMPVCMNGFLA
jgi:hypothetical protein